MWPFKSFELPKVVKTVPIKISLEKTIKEYCVEPDRIITINTETNELVYWYYSEPFNT